MRKVVIAVMCAVLLGQGVLLAAPVEKGQVPAGVDWVAHIDFQDMLSCELGKQVLAHITKDADAVKKLDGFAGTFGFDLTRDLESITLYRQGPDDARGALILRARLDQEKLLALLAANEAYETAKYGEHTLHHWLDDQRKGKDDDGIRWGAFYGDDLVVICRDQEILKTALDVLDGKTDSLAGTSQTLLPKFSRGSFLQVAAEGHSIPAKDEAHAAMLKKLASYSFEIGEAGGAVFVKTSLTAETAEAASQVQQMIQGLVAFAMISHGEAGADGPVNFWEPLLDSIEVTASKTTVQVRMSASATDIMTLLLHLEEKKAAAKEKKAAAEEKKTSKQ